MHTQEDYRLLLQELRQTFAQAYVQAQESESPMASWLIIANFDIRTAEALCDASQCEWALPHISAALKALRKATLLG